MLRNNHEKLLQIFIKIGIPSLIIITNLIIFYKKNLFFLIIIIFINLFIYISLYSCCILLKLKYDQWREERYFTRNIRLRKKIEKKINKAVIYNFKDDCIICLEQLDSSIILTCGHIYHKHCVDQMIEYNILTCPLCREEMV